MTGPRNSGSSLTGRSIARTPAPNTSVATPRISEASPIVAMITATIGRPSNLRSTTRSSPKQKAIMPTSAIAAASQNGNARTQRRGGNDGGEHDKLALREIDRVGRLVDQHEAERDQRIHQADHQAAGDQQQREVEVEFRHAPVPRRHWPAPACRGSASG